MISAISELALASNAKKPTSAEFNAKAHANEIASVFEAHQFCAEEGEGRHLSPEAKAVLKYHEYDGTNHTEVAEAIEVSCQETALSVDVRSGWGTPGKLEPEEFQILLSTGGPALRIEFGLAFLVSLADLLQDDQHRDHYRGQQSNDPVAVAAFCGQAPWTMVE